MKDYRCPVCQARFRSVPGCSRCGADLEPLMRLAAAAYAVRGLARDALAAGDYGKAAQLAGEAQWVQASESGDRLARVSKVAGRLTDT